MYLTYLTVRYLALNHMQQVVPTLCLCTLENWLYLRYYPQLELKIVVE